MPYRDVERRLADLEAADQARQERVYDRVYQKLSDADLDCFIAFLKREQATPGTDPTDDERRVLCHVETLTRADPEVRPCDLLGVPPEWEAGVSA